MALIQFKTKACRQGLADEILRSDKVYFTFIASIWVVILALGVCTLLSVLGV